MGYQRTNGFRGEMGKSWLTTPCSGAQSEFPKKYDDGLRRVVGRAIPRSECCYYTRRFLSDKVISLTFKLAPLIIFAMLLTPAPMLLVLVFFKGSGSFTNGALNYIQSIKIFRIVS